MDIGLFIHYGVPALCVLAWAVFRFNLWPKKFPSFSFGRSASGGTITREQAYKHLLDLQALLPEQRAEITALAHAITSLEFGPK